MMITQLTLVEQLREPVHEARLWPFSGNKTPACVTAVDTRTEILAAVPIRRFVYRGLSRARTVCTDPVTLSSQL